MWRMSLVCLMAVLGGSISMHDQPSKMIVSQLNDPCSTPNHEPGQCVALRSCEPIVTIVRNQPVPPLALKFLRHSECPGKAKLFCCANHRSPPPDPSNPWSDSPPSATWKTSSHFTADTDNILPLRSPAGHAANNHDESPNKNRPSKVQRNPVQADFPSDAEKPDAPASKADGKSGHSHPNLKLLPVETCGPRTAIDLENSSTSTNVDEHTWLVLLQYQIDDGVKSSMCGGVLLSERYVLTAAHCLTAGAAKGYKLVSVLVGEHDTASDPDCEGAEEGGGEEWCAEPAVEVAVERQIAHPEYSGADRNQFHDVALLRLAPHVLSNHGSITAVCLPLEASEASWLEGDKKDSLHLAGWGVSERNFGRSLKLQSTAHETNMKSCSSISPSRRFHPSSQLCAASRNATICILDNGGALTNVDKHGRVHVAAVASYGEDTCGNSVGVFTRVARYTEWILDQLEP